MNNDLTRILDTLSSIHRSFVYREQASCPATLIEALSRELPHLAPDSWVARLAWGGAFLNGRAAKTDRELIAPCRVEYYEPRFDIASAQSYFPEFKSEFILHEDEDLIVAFKPAGLPCLPTREQAHFTLKGSLQAYIARQNQELRIHLPSRLDTAVPGVIAASKTPRMHKVLQQAFEKRGVEKTYVLEVAGTFPAEEQIVDAPIARDTRHPVLRKVAAENGLPANTHFKVVCDSSTTENRATSPSIRTSILVAKPVTGRTHQIRVHAAHLGFPIVGDNFYNGIPAADLHLVSFAFGFFHPFMEKQLKIVLPERLRPDWLKGRCLPE